MKNRRILWAVVTVGVVIVGILAVPLIRRGVSSGIRISFAGGITVDGVPYPLQDSHLFHLVFTPNIEIPSHENRAALTLIINDKEYVLRALTVNDVGEIGGTRNPNDEANWFFTGRDSRGDETWRMEFTFDKDRLSYFMIRRLSRDYQPDVSFGRQGTSERVTVPCGERDAQDFFGVPKETTFWTRG